MALRYIATQEIWSGEPIDDVTHPANIEIWPDAELAAIGLERLPPASPPPVDPAAQFAAAIEAHVNDVAVSRSYSGAVSLASYVNSSLPQWAAEAAAFVVWRDSVWLYAYSQMAAVQSGARPLPTVETILGELPVIVWPE